MRSKLLIAALVSLAIVSAALATAIVKRLDAPAKPASTGAALIGGPFTLQDQAGHQVSDEAFRGRWMLVYFGYTFCPDICPLGLQVIGQALDHLPAPVAARLVPVFITLDPERDTVPVLANYVSLFDPRLIALTGSVEAIEAVKRAYRVYARKAEGRDPANYLVDHSTFTYLMGPDGQYVAHFGHGVTAEDMARRLVELIGGVS